MKKKSFKELFDQAKRRDTYWVASLILDFTEGLHKMMEANGVSRSELARRLESALLILLRCFVAMSISH
ncbi:MAG: hypothetical protein A2V86_02490 [Deltaproteobacteria bacterium RBG_16_49_23]|nr:MAG: hypothetical protein A2V86_02490 [Deltaproteobacteria bacterium RBG_16_49_23]